VAAGDLTTLADVKALSNIGAGGTASDPELTRLITAASTFIANATGRSFDSVKTANEIRDGSGGVNLYLREGPVVTVQSLYIGTVPIPLQPQDGQPGYFIVGNSVALYGYSFTRGLNNVRVSYTYGYTAIPADVAQAAIELVVSMYRRGPRDALLTKETTPATGAVTEYEFMDVPAFTQSVINKYKKVVPA